MVYEIMQKSVTGFMKRLFMKQKTFFVFKTTSWLAAHALFLEAFTHQKGKGEEKDRTQ